MKVTPLDLRQTQFRTVMRGFDRTEVRGFLSDAADDLEQALREIDRLRQELMRVEATLTEHRERETSLRNTLLTAQRLADQIRENAEQEARMKLREAEGRAEMLIHKARTRSEDLERGITEIKLRRRDVAASVESSMVALQNALDHMRMQDAEPSTISQSPEHATDGEPRPAGVRASASTAPAGEATPDTPRAPEDEEMLKQLRRLAREEEQRAATLRESAD